MMSFKGIRVLVLEGYARQSLPVIRALKDKGCIVSVLCNSKIDIAYASRLPDYKIIGTCDPEQYEESVNCVRKLLEENKYDLVIPLVDFSEKILSENKEEFGRYAKLACNDYQVFKKAQDKLSVMKVCMENDIPCPKTLFDIENYEDVLHSDLMYPIVLKPRRDCGARGFQKFDSKEEFLAFLEQRQINIKDYVVQEFIPQDLQNLSGNLFVDNCGEVKSSFIYASYRWFPIKGGTGTFNVMTDDSEIKKHSEKLVKLMGLRGCCGVDFIKDPRDGVAKILEINPRIMACAKIGFISGIDLVQQILEKEFGYDVSEMRASTRDIRVRMSQTDILWFLKSPDRFKAKPSFFSMKNTYDQTFSWDDPLPWFAFLFRGLKRYKTEMQRRG